MRKVILIVLFTVVCSSFSFAQKKEFFKESEMTSKKITLGSIYYAFIEGYFERLESIDNKADIIETGETIFIEQLKTSMKRQKNRRLYKCLYKTIDTSVDRANKCAAKVIRSGLNKSELGKKRKPGDIFYVMDGVLKLLPGEIPRGVFTVDDLEENTTGMRCYQRKLKPDEHEYTPRLFWCPRFTDKFKKKLEKFENDPSNEKVLGKNVVKYIEHVKLLNRIEEKLGETNSMWTSPVFLRGKNYDREALVALGGVNGDEFATISNYSLLGDFLNDSVTEVKKNRLSPQIKTRRILLKKYSIILQNIKTKLEEENYKKIDQDVKKLSSIYSKLASLEKGSNEISINFDRAIKVIFETNNLIQKSVSGKQESNENKLFSLALISFMQFLTDSIMSSLPEKYIVETKEVKKHLYNDYDFTSIENIINQIEIKNKERIKELKKENKRIDKFINTSDIIKKLNNIGIDSNLDKEITINSAFKSAEKQIMDNLSAEIFKSTRSIIDKLQDNELSDMTEELSKVASEVASEVASDPVFKESTSNSILDRKVGPGMVRVRHLVAAGRLPN